MVGKWSPVRRLHEAVLVQAVPQARQGLMAAQGAVRCFGDLLDLPGSHHEGCGVSQITSAERCIEHGHDHRPMSELLAVIRVYIDWDSDLSPGDARSEARKALCEVERRWNFPKGGA